MLMFDLLSEPSAYSSPVVANINGVESWTAQAIFLPRVRGTVMGSWR